jgi:hypothetical protein
MVAAARRAALGLSSYRRPDACTQRSASSSVAKTVARRGDALRRRRAMGYSSRVVGGGAVNGRGREFFSARTMRLLDVLLVAYIVVWVVIGILIGVDIRAQAELSDQVTRVGGALTDIGESLDIVAGVPIVGSGIGELAGRVLDAGESVQQSGRDSRAALEQMGVLVGLAFIAVPLMLVLPVYVPLRLAWRREVRAVAGALAGARPDLDLLLARRALAAMPYESLLALGDDPWARLERGEVGDLADAELARLGLKRPSL